MTQYGMPEPKQPGRVRKWLGGQVAEIKAIGDMRFPGWGGGSLWGGSGWGGSVWSGSSAWWSSPLPIQTRDYTSEVGDGTASSIVVSVMRWIARNFIAAPVGVREIVDPNEKNPIAIHPLVSLVRHPNEYYSGRDLMKQTVADLTINGNAYWRIISSGAGRPVQLWWIPYFLIEPRWDTNDPTSFISHYDYRYGGATPERIPPSEIVHFRDGLDPSNPRKGISPLRAMLREIYTDEEAARFTAALLANMGTPGVIIRPPDGDERRIDEDDARKMEAAFNAKTRGDRRGSTIVAGRRIEVTPFGFSPQQLNLKDLRRVPEERVSAVLGVPAIVAGLGAGLDRSTFANFAEARAAAFEECIIPLQSNIAGALHEQLLIFYINSASLERFEVYFDNTEIRVLQEDATALSQRKIAEYQGGIAMRSEVRRALGYEADDTDDVFLSTIAQIIMPAGEQLPSSIARVEEAPPPSEPSPTDTPPPPSPSQVGS